MNALRKSSKKQSINSSYSRQSRNESSDKPSTAAAYWAAEGKRKDIPTISHDSGELRIADLFSGCGGLSLGALIASRQLHLQLKIALAADMWQEALSVYNTNFSSVTDKSMAVDLSLLVEHAGSLNLSSFGHELAESVGGLDVVLAGPPCQGHSDLNNSSRRNDPRNLLYTIPVAFGLKKRAKLILIENVPTVVHATGRVVRSAFSSLEDQGYAVAEFVADAQDFGLPQTRKRHLLIASRMHGSEELTRRLSKISRRGQDVALWDFIDDLEFETEDEDRLITRQSKVTTQNKTRIDYLFDSSSFDLPNHLRPPCHRDKPLTLPPRNVSLTDVV